MLDLAWRPQYPSTNLLPPEGLKRAGSPHTLQRGPVFLPPAEKACSGFRLPFTELLPSADANSSPSPLPSAAAACTCGTTQTRGFPHVRERQVWDPTFVLFFAEWRLRDKRQGKPRY